jgi:hypothetical protein
MVAFLLMVGLVLCFANPAGFAGDVTKDTQKADDGGRITIGSMSGSGGSSRTPGSLTTIYASNNQYAGNMFDIDPAIDLEITAMDVNTEYVGNTAQIDVYYKVGTSVGFESDPNAWTLLASGTGAIQGADLPTFIDLSGNGVIFNAGQSYGIYVDLVSYTAGVQVLRYTNGFPTVYSNSHLSLTSHCGKGIPSFTGITFLDRIWNGTIYYDTKGGGALSVNPATISASTGGAVEFTLDAGANYANGKYLIMGSVTGTAPGILLPGGTVLPVNFDTFTNITIIFANSAFFQNTLGLLDGNGQASAKFDTLGPLNPIFVGVVINFAFPVPDMPAWFASNAVSVTIDP